MTVRNNLVDSTVASAFASGIILRGNGGPRPDDVAVYNNSFYNGATSSFDTAIVNVLVPYTNVVVRNNLGYAPNNTSAATAPFTGTFGAGFDASNNSTGAQIRGTNPFTTNPPTQPSHWQPTSGYAVDGGFPVPVFSDFFAAPRSGTYDLGAVNP
jgi:hypothetical protein